MNNTICKNGYFGEFGGRFIDEKLAQEFEKIEKAYEEFKNNIEIQKEYEEILKHYVGRPSPMYFAKNLSKKYGAQIYLKREDLNHTGAHKINHALGQALFAKKMGKTKLIAETGAGQHGVATATAATLMGLKCDIYMGEIDIIKEKPNVDRMRILGANIIPVSEGTKTLKEAVDKALEAYTKEYETALYAIGSVVGPHPFPTMIEDFQSVIGKEAKEQIIEMTGKLPNHIVACVGGGSNSIGLFSAFLNDESVKIHGAEPLGKGHKLGENAASLTYGKKGIIHGFKSLILQDEEGNIAPAYSIASGLDYPSVGPKHCYLKEIKRATYELINDIEAVDAFYELSKEEGIIPALESSHAVALGIKIAKEAKSNEIIVINISGRGDKDIEFIMKNYPKN